MTAFPIPVKIMVIVSTVSMVTTVNVLPVSTEATVR